MVTVDEAAFLRKISQRAIFSQVETGDVHFREEPGGELLICLNSLFRDLNEGEAVIPPA